MNLLKHRRETFLVWLMGFSTLTLNAQNLKSPNQVLEIRFRLDKEGRPGFDFYAEGLPILKDARLGFSLLPDVDLSTGFRIDSIRQEEYKGSWNPVWGEQRQILDHHRSMLVYLSKPGQVKDRRLNIEFRLFNDGLGFRYKFPQNGNNGNFIVAEELTLLPLQQDYEVYWMPGDFDSNEYPYTRSRLSRIGALRVGEETGLDYRHLVHDSLIQTPFLLISDQGYYMAIHEAALRHYPAMHLSVDRHQLSLSTSLVPDALGNMAYLEDGDQTPWRVLLYARKAGDLLTNRVILNLNEPSVIENTDFIKPGKFIGIWWEMHIGKSQWPYWDRMGSTHPDQWKPLPNHGANTANVKRHIDFASKHGIPYLLVEGWNKGWESWYGIWKERIFSFTEPYPDFDLDAIHKYAREKKVKLILHHETSGAVTDYERQLDSSVSLMHRYDYPGIKGGYVGRIIPRGEHHDGQWMVDHYERLAFKLGRQRLTLDLHEPVRPTGLHRTYPNWWTNEAARGNEFNAWSKGNPPEHETILPFTRLLGGPMDYTPGIFQIKMNAYGKDKKEQVHTTLAKQLALYVTLYSPLQMAADLIENYEKMPEPFQFIKDVPTDWDTTVVLGAEPGDYIYLARKGRDSEDWFVGAITDEQERIWEFEPNFLPPNKKYNMFLYRDGDQAHWESNPMDHKIIKKTIRSNELIRVRLAPGGGCAIHFTPAGQKRR
jgi:hypothetical protein